MTELAFIQNLHFLRPAWFLLLIPIALFTFLQWRSGDLGRQWQGVIASHLLPRMVLPGSQRRLLSPLWVSVVVLPLLVVALAGPSWQMQTSPFSEDQAALFIVMKVTPEMLAQDIQPSRLQRSVMKVHDLLETRKDVRTGLIAYAGSAHLVMPLTSDSGIINTFAAALDPEVMPMEGDTLSAAEIAEIRSRNPESFR